MIKSKNEPGLPSKGEGPEKKKTVDVFRKGVDTNKPKLYPVLEEEDSFTPPDDDSAEVKYNAKKNKS
jgi:hypothetical protein